MPECEAAHIRFVHTKISTNQSLLFLQVTAWSLPLSDNGEFPDFAEVWVEANRSRARFLTRYFSTANAAFFQRWIHEAKNAADREEPGPLSGRTDVAIAERAARADSK